VAFSVKSSAVPLNANLPPQFVLFAWLSILILLQGCATPAEKFQQLARDFGLRQQDISGLPYQHRLFLNARAQQAEHLAELHVYLDGDGTPWTSGHFIADDPTPRNPLILQLLHEDPAPALLLGRPCYYGLKMEPGCVPALWTAQRYSSAVVASLVAALEQWLANRHVDRIVLIGFSGGGALATLVGSRLPKVSLIITIAANLDVKGWSDYHGYLSLEGSLNPKTDAHLPDRIKQIHLAGLNDDNVPATLIAAFAASQPKAIYLPYAGFSHSCCWLEIWPAFLKTYTQP